MKNIKDNDGGESCKGRHYTIKFTLNKVVYT